MIYLYISPSCQSCRKTVKWFDEQKIAYKSINILQEKLTKDDIFRMLKNSLNGFDDIISKRSKPYMDGNLDIDSMKTSELVKFVIENPTILKRPIIVANSLIEVGYNQDDIRAFIPQEMRTFNYAGCKGCDNKENCTCEYKDQSLLLVKEIKDKLQPNQQS